MTVVRSLFSPQIRAFFSQMGICTASQASSLTHSVSPVAINGTNQAAWLWQEMERDGARGLQGFRSKLLISLSSVLSVPLIRFLGNQPPHAASPVLIYIHFIPLPCHGHNQDKSGLLGTVVFYPGYEFVGK